MSSYYCEAQDAGTILYRCAALENVPYNKLQSLQTISLIPVIRSITSVEMNAWENGQYHSIGMLEPDYGETVWSPLGISAWDESSYTTEYPQYAVKLIVH